MWNRWRRLFAEAFYSGGVMNGYALGFSLALAALVPVTTDFCMPSFIYGLLFGEPAACGIGKNQQV